MESTRASKAKYNLIISFSIYAHDLPTLTEHTEAYYWEGYRWAHYTHSLSSVQAVPTCYASRIVAYM